MAETLSPDERVITHRASTAAREEGTVPIPADEFTPLIGADAEGDQLVIGLTVEHQPGQPDGYVTGMGETESVIGKALRTGKPVRATVAQTG